MSKRIFLIAAVALLLLSAVAPTGVAAQDGAINTTQEAEIAIDQPSYVEGDVRVTSTNASQVYVASGATLRIAPQNFDDEDVVNFGVETSAGSLSYDDGMGFYRFEPGGETGTFRLFWVANTEVTVENGTNVTTEVRQVRYVTRVRVESAASMHHLTDAEYQERQEMVELGEYANSTVQELRDRDLWLFDLGDSDRQAIENMAKRAQSTGAPFRALTGGSSQFILLLFLTLGGAFIGGIGVFLILRYAYKYYKIRNERAAIRAVEGDVDTRELEVEERERMAALAKTTWADVFDDDHVVAGMRDEFGETLLSGWMTLTSTFQPKHVVRDRLTAMGMAGWAAQPVQSDGGDGAETTYELVKGDPEEDDALESLVPVSDDVLEGIDWDAPAIRNFDLAGADVSTADVEIDAPTLTLSDLVAELDVQKRHWESEEEFGGYLYDLVEAVRTGDFCDEQGRPNDVRYAIEAFLETALLLDDRHHFPTAGYFSDAFEFALCDYDRADDVQRYIKDVQDGVAGDDE